MSKFEIRLERLEKELENFILWQKLNFLFQKKIQVKNFISKHLIRIKSNPWCETSPSQKVYKIRKKFVTLSLTLFLTFRILFPRRKS